MCIYFARFLERDERHEDAARECFSVYHPHDEGLPRLRECPHGQLLYIPDLDTGEEKKTSPTYNESMPRSSIKNGLFGRFVGLAGRRIIWNLGNPMGGDGWQSDRLQLLSEGIGWQGWC